MTRRFRPRISPWQSSGWRWPRQSRLRRLPGRDEDAFANALFSIKWRVEFRPEVEQDVAVAWYEARRPGLGVEFAEEIIRILDALSENPLLNSRRHSVKDVRWRYPARFPYCVIYEARKSDHTVTVPPCSMRRQVTVGGGPGYESDRRVARLLVRRSGRIETNHEESGHAEARRSPGTRFRACSLCYAKPKRISPKRPCGYEGREAGLGLELTAEIRGAIERAVERSLTCLRLRKHPEVAESLPGDFPIGSSSLCAATRSLFSLFCTRRATIATGKDEYEPSSSEGAFRQVCRTVSRCSPAPR